MTTFVTDQALDEHDPLDAVEEGLVDAGWGAQRDDEECLQSSVPTRWGECPALFVWRPDLPAVQLSVSLDMKAPTGRREALCELVTRINEHLWLGHFEFWIDERAIFFRHTLPLADRGQPESGEIDAVLNAARDAIETYLPAFNFVAWAGQAPEQALESALVRPDGEA